jgi:hypothetical protein
LSITASEAYQPFEGEPSDDAMLTTLLHRCASGVGARWENGGSRDPAVRRIQTIGSRGWANRPAPAPSPTGASAGSSPARTSAPSHCAPAWTPAVTAAKSSSQSPTASVPTSSTGPGWAACGPHAALRASGRERSGDASRAPKPTSAACTSVPTHDRSVAIRSTARPPIVALFLLPRNPEDGQI